MYTPSRVGKMVGVSRRTIINWIDHDKLNHLFSDGAREKGGRALNEDDLFIAHTIKQLRDNLTHDWEEIARKIEDGYRIKELPLSAADVDTGLTPAELFGRTLGVAQERDAALEQRDNALQKLDLLQAQHKEDLRQLREDLENRHGETIEKMQDRHYESIREIQDRHDRAMRELQEQVKELSRELGRLEGRLEDE